MYQTLNIKQIHCKDGKYSSIKKKITKYSSKGNQYSFIIKFVENES